MGDRTRKLTLQIEAEGRSFDFSNQTLVLECKEEPTIKLHFLRSGILEDNPKQSHIKAKMKTKDGKSQKDENGNVILEEVIITDPKLENFSTVHTGLNPGYIYIIDENKPDEPIEFEVDEYGNFKSISWEKGGDGFPDVRTTDGKSNTNGFYEAEFESIVWAAYSPIQWTKAYYDSLAGDTNKRKERMTQIQASGFPLGLIQSTTEHAPYSYITTYFPADRKNLCRAIQQKIDTIQRQEEKREKNRTENPNHQEPDLQTDMFITLEDPISSAAEISNFLSDKILDFKALVDAIQTGETLKQAYDRILDGNLEGPKPEKEYQSLISLALTCYLMVYNDNDAILDYDGGSPGWNFSDRHSLDPRPKTKTFYGKHTTHTLPNTSTIGYGLDYQKLEGILGIKERKALREEVFEYKKDFATYLDTKEFKTVLDDYIDNLVERTIEGRGLVLEIIDAITINTYDFDRHMLLKKHYKNSDEWIDWVYRMIDKDYEEEFSNTNAKSKTSGYEKLDPIYALLTPTINLDKVIDKGRSISHKIAKVYKKKLGHHAKQAFVMKQVGRTMFKEITEKQEFIVKKLNENLTVYDEAMFHIEDGEMRMRLHELGVEIDDDYIKQSNHVRVKGKQNYGGKKGNLLKRKPGFKNTKMQTEVLRAIHGSEGIEILESVESGGTQNKIGLRVRKKIDADQIKSNAKNVKIAQMVNGRAFNGVFAILEFINLGAAFNKVRKDHLNDEINEKNITNFAGASIKMGEAGLNLRKAFVEFGGKEVSSILKNSTKVASVVGGAFTAGMCFWESIEAMDKGDVDSGIALAGAGAAFALSTAAPYIFASASVAGPVGWIAAGIGVGLIIIATLLSDSELETFFKNFVLSDTEAFPKDEEDTPMIYSRKVLASKEDLVDDDYTETLMHPADAEASLFDAIICKQIAFEPIDPDTQTFTSGRDSFGVSTSSSVSTASRFTATMVFSQFFNDPDQLEAYAYFYPKGVKNGGAIKMIMNKPITVKDPKRDNALQVEFSVPDIHKDKIRLQSEVIFAGRLHLDKSQHLHFPYPLAGEERFLGAKIRVRSLSAGLYISSLKQNKAVNITSLGDLKNPETW
ncbi:toxin VasX [Aquimarina sp. Aq107]|uniref:toxin VasX n=1 Tax=Aquimarina sp. Aq107 TaxID=1191912 RepID=UPI000D55464B|nr:toxin VasX [Aquimarina sp. Aq107]